MIFALRYNIRTSGAWFVSMFAPLYTLNPRFLEKKLAHFKFDDYGLFLPAMQCYVGYFSCLHISDCLSSSQRLYRSFPELRPQVSA